MDKKVRIRGTRGKPEISRKEAERIHEEARRGPEKPVVRK